MCLKRGDLRTDQRGAAGGLRGEKDAKGKLHSNKMNGNTGNASSATV
jgi:hypothetical protein